ncbi:MAG: carboxypeptidase regulatory-like domain-containing protein [Candidatus Acidiferrales bacterium]
MKFRQAMWLTTVLAILALVLPGLAMAQSVVTGGLTGTVTDPSGAVIVGANVTLNNAATGESQTATTGAGGIYQFSLLKPGAYTITTQKDGFKTITQSADVLLGQIATANVKMELGAGSTTVEVTGQGALLQTEDANISSNFDTRQIQNIPNPGGDITYIAQTAPGITMNNSQGGGYGNFSAFGLPGTANLFTINGNDYNDPFLNLNNSGASNLLLGGNELQEVAVVSNGYTGQYGRQAGAQVDYTTKSGSNAFHGNAVYYWTGRELNANDALNKLGEAAGGAPNARPFENNNQWAASLGGPIKRDKAFFFVNTEGIRYIFGSTHNVTLMTPAFQSYVLGNVPQDAATQAFYKNIFGLYNAAPGISKALPNANSCPGFATAPGLTGGACTKTYLQSLSNGNKEWLLSGRVDYSLSDSDKIFGRVKFDRGVQPTYTDAINPVFNDESIQPQDEGQLNYTHVFSPNVVNNFIGSVLYYSAIFGNPNPGPALALFPGNLAFTVDGSNLTALGTGSGTPGGFAQGFAYPQGRNVTQWQLVDDVSIARGNHAFKMGVNFRRDDVSDHAASEQALYPAVTTSLFGFANDQVFEPGIGGNVQYNFAVNQVQPLAIYSFGLYFQDEYRVSSNLKFTLTLRADRNSGGACKSNCAALPVSPFNNMIHGAGVAYSSDFGGSFNPGSHSIFPSVEKAVFEPRFGMAWSPIGQNTVIRAGVGLFTDLYPGFLLDGYTTNAPQVNKFNIPQGTLAFAANSATFPTSGVDLVTGCNAAFLSNFNSGGNLNTYAAAAPTCAAVVPGLNDTPSKVLNPKYVEWNLELQHTFGRNSVISANYVGNRGFDELLVNPYLNGFCDPTVCGAPTVANPNPPPATLLNPTAPFAKILPGAALDPRVANVNFLQNTGYSNYNGITLSWQENGWHGLSGRVNYTYSHALDTISNGALPFSVYNSILNQINPYTIADNYGAADYDARHQLTANYVYELPFKSDRRLVNAAIGG